MKLRAFVLLITVLLMRSTVCLAEGLSAQDVFGDSQAAPKEVQSAEQRLERTRELFAERAKNAASKAQAGAAWKAEEQPSLGGAGFKMIQALGLCVGILLIGLHFFKKYNARSMNAGGGRRMRVIERMSIGPKTALVLVELEGKRLLLSVGADRVSHITTDAQDELPLELTNSMELVCQDDVRATAA